jgi:hypothetical protein
MVYQLGKARMLAAGRAPLPQRKRRASTGSGRARLMADLERIGRALAQAL